jgi:hemerythrin-like domain-containing protein
MRHEREEARAHTAALHRAYDLGDAAAFAKAAGAYVELLRGHIHKEDHCLWPMADQLLSPAAQAEILRAFAVAEEQDVGDGVHERMIEALDRLLATCGLPARQALLLARNPGGCGCGGAAGKGGAS